MADPLTDQLEEKIAQASQSYYRLVLLIGRSGAGKTRVLQSAAKKSGTKPVNVNLKLSQKMLDMSERERQLHLPQLLGDMIDSINGDVVFLDNIELLFDEKLKTDPLRLLKGLSRNRTIVAAWNGEEDDGYITYADSGHPEYRRYPADDVILICLK